MAALITDSRYEELKRSVVEMFEECAYDTYPINGFEIAARLQYRLVPYSKMLLPDREKALSISNDGYCAITKRDDGIYEYTIFYNDNYDHLPERQNWTILHEIGHIYLGHLDENPKAVEVAEAEANFFAKYSIAPPPLINVLHCTCTEDIMKHFFVSRRAAEYSLDYYNKWMQYGPPNYVDYEIELIETFREQPMAM